MWRATSTILDSGDRFPELAMETVHHGHLTLPQGFGEGWGAIDRCSTRGLSPRTTAITRAEYCS